MPYSTQHLCSIEQPRACSQPLTNTATSASDNMSKLFARFCSGVLSTLSVKKVSNTSTSSEIVDLTVLITFSRSDKISSSDLPFIGCETNNFFMLSTPRIYYLISKVTCGGVSIYALTVFQFFQILVRLYCVLRNAVILPPAPYSRSDRE